MKWPKCKRDMRRVTYAIESDPNYDVYYRCNDCGFIVEIKK